MGRLVPQFRDWLYSRGYSTAQVEAIMKQKEALRKSDNPDGLTERDLTGSNLAVALLIVIMIIVAGGYLAAILC